MHPCDICGREGTVEGNIEFSQEKLGPISNVGVDFGKDSHGRRFFTLCEKCRAKELKKSGEK